MVDDPSPPSTTTYGTAAADAPVTRADFERALRHLNLGDLELRDALLRLGARVVALTDELTRRVDGVEPSPAPPGTPAPPPEDTVEAAVARQLPDALAQVLAADAPRVLLDVGGDKYTTVPATPPCAELLHLCGARCCTLDFPLSTADLDEGVIRWDYGQPYRIRQRTSDGYCVHCDPDDHRCTVHAQRPRVCRTFHCQDDPRIWIDYARRIPAPAEAARIAPPPHESAEFDLMERLAARTAVVAGERRALGHSFADATAQPGPPVTLREPPRHR